MERLRSADADIFYEIRGNGPPVVLLHPFPCDHEFWDPVAVALESRYRLILPDLRGHGDSEIGEGPAFMSKHASDIARLLDAAGVSKAVFIGCSIGGYILFEFWRRYRERVSALALCDTRPQADTAEARSNRLKAAAAVLEQGAEPFLETMIPKLMGRTTLSTRPDLVAGARAMMSKISAENISLVQRGMAERPDSVADLKTINVPTLIAIGEEDELSTVADGELMRQNIAGSHLIVIPKAGHYAPWEQPELAGKVLRQFLDDVARA
jgi:3-oxoadipate enol-lactonase